LLGGGGDEGLGEVVVVSSSNNHNVCVWISMSKVEKLLAKEADACLNNNTVLNTYECSTILGVL
jgi:hypothetical protein